MLRYAALILALVWFALRIVLHLTDWFEDVLQVSVLINLFLLVMLIYKAIRDEQSTTSTFLEVAKAGMRQASLYAFLVAFLLFIFYTFIDTDFIARGIDDYQAVQMAQVDGEGGWEAIKSANPTIGDLTMEEYFDEQRTTALSLFSPWFIASSALFIMVIVSVLYSLMATWFHQRLLRTIKK